MSNPNDYLTPLERVQQFSEIMMSRLRRGAVDDPNDEQMKMIRENQALAIEEFMEGLELSWDYYMRPTKETE